MKQTGHQLFSSDDKKILVFCDNTLTLGAIHDELLSLKGIIVDMIVKAQKEEAEVAAKVRAADAKKEEEAKVVEVPVESK